jgi:hypothetical protein
MNISVDESSPLELGLLRESWGTTITRSGILEAISQEEYHPLVNLRLSQFD